MTTVAEIVAETLYANGVRTVFGLPGGETVEVLDAMRRRGIRFILVHNESSAVFMADALARLTGVPGVCLTTLGPGACNAVVGVGHAYLDRAPVIIITAQKPDYLLPDYTHQVLDLHALFAPITKGSFKLGERNPGTAVQAAVDLAAGGRPGCVHLQVSNEDASLAALADAANEAPQAETRGGPDPTRLVAAHDLLARAKRPVIVVGLGLEPERPYAALADLAETASAPVIVAPKGKGALPDSHPLAAGVIGLTRSDPAYEVLDEADCIVAVGFDVVELVKPWQHDAPLIWIAPWENQDPVLPAEVELVGPMAPVLQQLADSDFATEATWGVQRVAKFRAKLAAFSLPEAQPGRLLPQTALSVLRAHLPDDALMAVDVGSHKIFSSLSWPTLAPNRFLLSNGLSSMGYALPAAIGASLALPGEPVVCLTGDAGLAMSMGELGVLAQLGAPVVVVVLNDSALDLIRSAQVRAGRPVHGTEFVSPDFTAVGRAYGIESVRVPSEAECATAIEHAVGAGGPRLIEVMVDPVSYPTTPKV